MKKFKIKKEDIKELIEIEGPNGCLATDKITVDGCKVGYMYREEPVVNTYDSGWRFFSGDEEEEYCDNPDNISIYQINTIANYDQDIIPFLNAPYGSAFIRDENGNFIKDVIVVRE